jgi:hypothetical protein
MLFWLGLSKPCVLDDTPRHGTMMCRSRCLENPGTMFDNKFETNSWVFLVLAYKPEDHTTRLRDMHMTSPI